MSAINLTQFGGALPLWNPVLLPDGQAASVKNGYMLSGAVEGWIVPTRLRQLKNSASLFAYRIPVISRAQAIAYAIFTTLPTEGDTITVGEYAYTFSNNSALYTTVAYTVKIGASLAETTTNLVAALTLDYGQVNTDGDPINAGVLYGPGGSANPNLDVTAISTDNPQTTEPAQNSANQWVVIAVSADYGAAYNTVAVAASNAASVQWSSTFNSVTVTTTLTGGSNPSFDNNISGNAFWLEFLDPDTNVVKSEVVNDQFNRFYFASPSTQPQYNTYDRIAAGDPAWLLGVPAPGCSPAVEVTGGGNYATQGQTVTGGAGIAAFANLVYLFPIVPSGAVQLSSVSILPAAIALTTNMAAVLYADANANGATPTYPGALLNTGDIVNGMTAGTTAVSTFANPTNLEQNTPYWVGFIMDQNASLTSAAPGMNTNQTVHFPATFNAGPSPEAPAPGAGLKQGGQDFYMVATEATSDVFETRAYVYTWVTAYDEEGPPSPPTLQSGWSNGTWSVSLFTPVPDDMGVDRNITSINLYRTVPDTAGNTVYFFVANVPVTQETYVDTILDNVIALNNQLPSTNWFPPPEDLQGIIALPNGMYAGFVNNEVWFCQPYFPHAWPVAYSLTVDFPIVGLGYTLGSLVVCTAANPYVITGVSPGNMTQVKCAMANPCLSRGSIVSTDNGVFYESSNGLIQVVNSGIATNLTDSWVGRDNWQKLTPQKYGRAVPTLGQYFCYGTTSPPSVSPADNSQAQTGFTLQLAADTMSFSIWPQPGGHRVGFSQLGPPNGQNMNNIFLDPWTGIVLMIQEDGYIYQYDFSAANAEPQRQVIDYYSKVYHAPSRRNFAAARVYFDVPAGETVQTPVPFESFPTDPRWEVLVENNPGVFGVLFVYANKQLVDAKEIRGSGDIIRIVSGFKAEFWQFRIKTRCVINNLQVATSTKELGTI